MARTSSEVKREEQKRDHVVLTVRDRGLNRFTHAHGPFTKAEALAFAEHESEDSGCICHVEHMQPIQHHMKWLFRDLNA